MFKGVCTALVTPFDKNGNIDYKAYEKFLEFQIGNNVDALLVCGTTGEPATMTESEKNEIINFTIKYVNKKVPVVVGCGSNCTKTAIENAIKAQQMGADALLVVTPYYNKCTQDGLYEHYKRINDSVNIPIIMYNVPGRTGVNIKPTTVFKLSKLKNIIGIKEASGNINQISEIARNLDNLDNFSLFSGDDALSLPMISLGATGIISVASNIIPQQMHDLVSLYLNGKYNEALKIHNKYVNLMDCLFCEVNPIPIKAACNKIKLMENTLRLPLTQITEENEKKLEKTMKDCGLI